MLASAKSVEKPIYRRYLCVFLDHLESLIVHCYPVHFSSEAALLSVSFFVVSRLQCAAESLQGHDSVLQHYWTVNLTEIQ